MDAAGENEPGSGAGTTLKNSISAIQPLSLSLSLSLYNADTGIMIIMFSLSGTKDPPWLQLGDLAYGEDREWWENRNNGAGEDYVHEVAQFYHQIEVV